MAFLLKNNPDTEYLKKRNSLHKKLEKANAVQPRRMELPKIYTENYVLRDGFLSFCALVILYNKKTKTGTILHMSNPNMIKKRLPEAISQLSSVVDEKIECIIGGFSREDVKGEKNQEAVEEVLKEYKQVKLSNYKKLIGMNIGVIGFWLKTGKIEFVGFDKEKNKPVYGEFKF